eukprot:356905-Chlamydomonas_euryale.AAC.3
MLVGSECGVRGVPAATGLLQTGPQKYRLSKSISPRTIKEFSWTDSSSIWGVNEDGSGGALCVLFGISPGVAWLHFTGQMARDLYSGGGRALDRSGLAFKNLALFKSTRSQRVELLNTVQHLP